jgi:hypothetical protein
MKTGDSQNDAWLKLARLGAQASRNELEMPFGFATRVVAAWKSSPSEGFLAAFEGITWRGFMVATGVLGVCTLLGYNTLAGLFTGETQFFGNLFGGVFGL